MKIKAKCSCYDDNPQDASFWTEVPATVRVTVYKNGTIYCANPLGLWGLGTIENARDYEYHCSWCGEIAEVVAESEPKPEK